MYLFLTYIDIYFLHGMDDTMLNPFFCMKKASSEDLPPPKNDICQDHHAIAYKGL